MSRIGVAALSVGLLAACGPDATFENRSTEAIRDVRWVLKESPEVTVYVGTVAPRASQETELPADFGESSLWIEGRRGGERLSTECGYIESSTGYVAIASIEADGPIQCKVKLETY